MNPSIRPAESGSRQVRQSSATIFCRTVNDCTSGTYVSPAVRQSGSRCRTGLSRVQTTVYSPAKNCPLKGACRLCRTAPIRAEA